MILVSVGTQFPFDRMIRTIDQWAVDNGRTDVIAQTGPADYQPRALKCFAHAEPVEFARLQAEAEVVVAHAGMGSILGALQSMTPIIIMPREFARGEHRNDHQLATARRFDGMDGVYVAWNEDELRALLDRVGELKASEAISPMAPAPFREALRDFAERAPRKAWPFTRSWWIGDRARLG